MLELVATCDNCGATTADPILLKRKNGGYRVNLDQVGCSGRDMTDAGWLFTVVGHGPAVYCPQCVRAYKLAVFMPSVSSVGSGLTDGESS